MYRTIDELGRVVIPSEYRKALQISEKERLSMKIKGKKIVIKKAPARCVFCGKSSGLGFFNEKALCSFCYKKLLETFYFSEDKISE